MELCNSFDLVCNNLDFLSNDLTCNYFNFYIIFHISLSYMAEMGLLGEQNRDFFQKLKKPYTPQTFER